MPSGSAQLSTSFAEPPSAVNLFASVRWKGVLLMSAAGSQMRVGPEGFRTSARVVISNVRQVAASAGCANRSPVLLADIIGGSTALAETMLAERRKSRRFIIAPSETNEWHRALGKSK